MIQTVIDETLRMIAENPDTRYERRADCSYVHGACTNGTKGCLFGQVLRNLNLEDVYEEGQDIGECLDTHYPGLHPVIRRWFWFIQKEQDNGHTWQEALDRANKERTLVDWIRIVRLLAKERPDVVYKPTDSISLIPGCFYDRGMCSDGSVGCIFGQASRLLGQPLTGSGHINVRLSDVKGTDAEKKWCWYVQSKQDGGKSWSDAVTSVDKYIYDKYGVQI